MSVKSIKIETFVQRATLFVFALICLFITFTFTKWCLANAVSSQADDKAVAEFAALAAPDDPQTHFVSAVLLEKTFLPEDLQKSLEEYEKATALSPQNYLSWLSLGRVRELTGDADGAEKALRKASELAPNYAEVQWALGNVLLRQGKSEEAFPLIRRAVESDPNFTNAAVIAAWQVSEGEIPRIKQAIGDSANVNAALAVFLARQQRYDEAFELWNSLPADAKREALKKSGEELSNQFMTAKKYRAAQQVLKEVSDGGAANSEFEQIANGGFESGIKMQNAGIFEWRIDEGNHPQIGLDTQNRRSGERSLLLIFNSADGKGFRSVAQTVAVQPEKNYQFSIAYKSELKTSAGLKWEIADAADGKIFGSTAQITGNSDWTNTSINFNAAATTEAVVIRLTRENCPTGICPVSGKVWFDDFTLAANSQQK